MMRRLTLILWLILLVVACQRSPGATPGPTETPAATEAAGTGGEAGESAGNNGGEAAFVDNADLRAARFAVVYHMTQIEGMTFPLVDQWTPESVSENEGFRTHTFRSGEWTLSLAAPLEDTPDLLYRVTITGPDDFFYQADMDEDGNLAPAQ